MKEVKSIYEQEQLTLFPDNAEYDAFVDKFVPKKTTDDCYTPENIYNAVAEWVEKEYGVNRERFVRPFWPGGDYEAFDYPVGCVVVDNPPFSIRAKIVDFYTKNGISFFLFSPALTLLMRNRSVCHIAVGVNITYENGAVVPTSFVTNLEDTILRTAPALFRAVKAADNLNATKAELPVYEYPNEVITAAIAQRMCHYGVIWKLTKESCRYVSELDEQKAHGKAIFGGGYILSERAAAERAAAERAAAERAAAERVHVWNLSEREQAISRGLK